MYLITKRLLQAVLWTSVTIMFVVGAQLLVMGASAVPDAGSFSASMDSEIRFLAIFWLAYASVILWTVLNIEERYRFVPTLMLVLFASGCARVLSMAIVGLPDQFYVVATGAEFFLSTAGFLLYQRFKGQPK